MSGPLLSYGDGAPRMTAAPALGFDGEPTLIVVPLTNTLVQLPVPTPTPSHKEPARK